MNEDRVRAQLAVDEGKRLKVYRDSLGLPTVGIGHLVRPSDNLKVGDVISEARCNELFSQDFARTVSACKARISGWDTFPGEVQEILVNMAFNLGIDGLLAFKNTLRHIRERNYAAAARGMSQSLWAKQVKSRATRLIDRMEALATSTT